MNYFDKDFIKKLEYLNIISKKLFSGKSKGEWRSRHYGSSVEFADYKNYTPGDDFRYIDWNVYGRLEQLFLKLFLEEEELNVYILIDISKSMDFGSPSKIDYARKIAAAFAYIGLAGFDKVSIYAFRDDIVSIFPATKGKSKIFSIFEFLERFDADGNTDLSAAAKKFTISTKRRGLVILISDFFDPMGYESAIKRFMYRKNEIYAIQVLSEEETTPEFIGDYELIDSESGEKINITLGEKGLKDYRAQLNLFCKNVENFCKKRGIYYILTSTDYPFEDLILKYFRQKRLVG